MALVYDSKTGKASGKMERITPEERAEWDARIASGEYGIFSEHPSHKEVGALLDQQEKHGFGWGIRKLIKEIRNGEASER